MGKAKKDTMLFVCCGCSMSFETHGELQSHIQTCFAKEENSANAAEETGLTLLSSLAVDQRDQQSHTRVLRPRETQASPFLLMSNNASNAFATDRNGGYLRREWDTRANGFEKWRLPENPNAPAPSMIKNSDGVSKKLKKVSPPQQANPVDKVLVPSGVPCVDDSGYLYSKFSLKPALRPKKNMKWMEERDLPDQAADGKYVFKKFFATKGKPDVVNCVVSEAYHYPQVSTSFVNLSGDSFEFRYSTKESHLHTQVPLDRPCIDPRAQNQYLNDTRSQNRPTNSPVIPSQNVITGVTVCAPSMPPKYAFVVAPQRGDGVRTYGQNQYRTVLPKVGIPGSRTRYIPYRTRSSCSLNDMSDKASYNGQLGDGSTSLAVRSGPKPGTDDPSQRTKEVRETRRPSLPTVSDVGSSSNITEEHRIPNVFRCYSTSQSEQSHPVDSLRYQNSSSIAGDLYRDHVEGQSKDFHSETEREGRRRRDTSDTTFNPRKRVHFAEPKSKQETNSALGYSLQETDPKHGLQKVTNLDDFSVLQQTDTETEGTAEKKSDVEQSPSIHTRAYAYYRKLQSKSKMRTKQGFDECYLLVDALHNQNYCVCSPPSLLTQAERMLYVYGLLEHSSGGMEVEDNGSSLVHSELKPCCFCVSKDSKSCVLCLADCNRTETSQNDQELSSEQTFPHKAPVTFNEPVEVTNRGSDEAGSTRDVGCQISFDTPLSNLSSKLATETLEWKSVGCQTCPDLFCDVLHRDIDSNERRPKNERKNRDRNSVNPATITSNSICTIDEQLYGSKCEHCKPLSNSECLQSVSDTSRDTPENCHSRIALNERFPERALQSTKNLLEKNSTEAKTSVNDDFNRGMASAASSYDSTERTATDGDSKSMSLEQEHGSPHFSSVIGCCTGNDVSLRKLCVSSSSLGRHPSCYASGHSICHHHKSHLTRDFLYCKQCCILSEHGDMSSEHRQLSSPLTDGLNHSEKQVTVTDRGCDQGTLRSCNKARTQDTTGGPCKSTGEQASDTTRTPLDGPMYFCKKCCLVYESVDDYQRHLGPKLNCKTSTSVSSVRDCTEGVHCAPKSIHAHLDPNSNTGTCFMTSNVDCEPQSRYAQVFTKQERAVTVTNACCTEVNGHKCDVKNHSSKRSSSIDEPLKVSKEEFRTRNRCSILSHNFTRVSPDSWNNSNRCSDIVCTTPKKSSVSPTSPAESNRTVSLCDGNNEEKRMESIKPQTPPTRTMAEPCSSVNSSAFSFNDSVTTSTTYFQFPSSRFVDKQCFNRKRKLSLDALLSPGRKTFVPSRDQQSISQSQAPRSQSEDLGVPGSPSKSCCTHPKSNASKSETVDKWSPANRGESDRHATEHPSKTCCDGDDACVEIINLEEEMPKDVNEAGLKDKATASVVSNSLQSLSELQKFVNENIRPSQNFWRCTKCHILCTTKTEYVDHLLNGNCCQNFKMAREVVSTCPTKKSTYAVHDVVELDSEPADLCRKETLQTLTEKPFCDAQEIDRCARIEPFVRCTKCSVLFTSYREFESHACK